MLVVFGTRPEAIKLCPLISVLNSQYYAGALKPVVCVTGQHREMLDQVLEVFGIKPDFDLRAMQPGQTLSELTVRLLGALPAVFDEVKPSLTVVQGDTTTTFCAAMSSFYAGVPVAHVEAGLRTFNIRSPFPEEMNRLLTTRLSSLHFAATQGGRENLVAEGIDGRTVEVTGNTGIDAVLSIRDRLQEGAVSGLQLPPNDGRKLIVVTAHRRESFGQEFTNICQAIARIADRQDVQVVWPVHRNPNVTGPVNAILRDRQDVVLLDPLEYLPFVDLMVRSYLIITDSGGIQEEGPSLGKPILVLRDTTERPEAVKSGTVRLVGTDPDKIVAECTRLIENGEAYSTMARAHNPYGDGHSCGRIARRIALFLGIPLT